MPYVVKDRVKVTSTTTGTGPMTLGAAATGFQSFASISVGSGWNIATSSYVRSFSVAAQDITPSDLFFKTDGTKMYIVGDSNDRIFEYNLSTAWDISTASFLQSFSTAAQETTPESVYFRDDGLKMYVLGQTTGITDKVSEYTLSSAWNITTASYVQNFSVNAQDAQPYGIFFKPDGLKMYISGASNDSIYEYNLSSAWNISTASFLQSFSVTAQDGNPSGLYFRSDGLKMYFAGANNDAVFEYNLGTAWDVTTASFVQSYSIAAQETNVAGVFFKPDGGSMYVVGPATDAVYQYFLAQNNTYYCITNSTDWEVGIGTVTNSGATLSRDTVLESSNSNALVNWGAGSKDVFCTFPSDATEGTVPTADNSSVGTDLYAWTNLKKQLDAGVINGVPYDNNSTAGVVSTFSLVYTTSSAYSGGVLAPNGDIHFVPDNANRGQKISTTGLVSTYSLIYTISGGYEGGVLAPNGDIHFVPYNADRGQKISSSGVVSTYSLVYTIGAAYWGGVVSPNGDIHFIPENGRVGQKISTAGVVSTYSLVYTNAAGYNGGVLAPNGDIHFIPRNAVVGQKISAAGVVSTYSLVYTTTGAYRGGVLAPNGDIHFIPFTGIVGQKISSAGVVSTYSLVYTLSSNYSGGVLAPNGDIHFVPRSAPVGQKVSVAGVVSTYSLIYTASGANVGGVLSSNGEIYFIPLNAIRGQKISTNTTRPIGYALSPFFNKF